jgi:hypothetical protein
LKAAAAAAAAEEAVPQGDAMMADLLGGASAAAAGTGVRPVAGSSRGHGAAAAAAGLVCLSLDCHFVAVSPEQMQEALQNLQGLKVSEQAESAYADCFANKLLMLWMPCVQPTLW